MEPPQFVQQLKNVTAQDGKEVVLTCMVQGTPMPEIQWYHNHRNIDKSEDFVINYDRKSGKIDLVIVDCLPDDHGRFKCVASNRGGQAITECVLTVQTKPETKVIVEQTEVRKESVESVHSKSSSDTETKLVRKVVKRVSGQPPRFTKPIQPCVVKEGDSCKFHAVCTGAPVPEISWLKDKTEYKPEGRHIPGFNPETGECTLIINNATPEDVGVYSCRAFNVAGRATCTANVVVVRKYQNVLLLGIVDVLFLIFEIHVQFINQGKLN